MFKSSILACWRSMLKSNRSFMSIYKRGSELCSQLVIQNKMSILHMTIISL